MTYSVEYTESEYSEYNIEVERIRRHLGVLDVSKSSAAYADAAIEKDRVRYFIFLASCFDCTNTCFLCSARARWSPLMADSTKASILLRKEDTGFKNDVVINRHRVVVPRVSSPKLAKQLYKNKYTTQHPSNDGRSPSDVVVQWSEMRPNKQVSSEILTHS